MEVMIINNKFQHEIIVDEFKSLIWTDRYNSAGDFELYIAANSRFLPSIKQGYYAYIKESEHLMIIESINIETDFDEGDHAIITGRSLESMLDRRIVWNKTEFLDIEDKTIQDGIEQLLNENIINPTNSKRKINNFIFERSTDSKITTETFSAQYNGENLYDVICDICQSFDIGFKITLNDENKFVFKLYNGTDRTYDQTSNPYVIFSPKFENIINSDYLESEKTLKNVTLVTGEDIKDETIKVNATNYLVSNDPNVRTDGIDVEFKNITDVDKLLTDIMNKEDSYRINGVSYTGVYHPLEIGYKDYKASVNLKKKESYFVQISNINYYANDYEVTDTDLVLYLEDVADVDSLLNYALSHDGVFKIKNKTYKGYTKFNGIQVNGRDAVVTFVKPDKLYELGTCKMGETIYPVYKDVSSSDTSLQLVAAKANAPQYLYSNAKANNGKFVVNDFGDNDYTWSLTTGIKNKKSFTGYKKVDNLSIDGALNSYGYHDISISLSRNSTKPEGAFDVTINNKTYKVEDWSEQDGVLDITFYNPSNITTLWQDCLAHKSDIVISGTTYKNYTEVGNVDVSFEERSESELPTTSKTTTVVMNNVTYTIDKAYSSSNSSLSLKVIGYSNINTLYNNARANNGRFVIAGKTFTGYDKISSISIDEEGNSSISISKEYDSEHPYSENITINGHSYKIESWSASDGSLSLNFTDVSNFNTLVSDCKAHTGNITVNGITYSGFTVASGFNASWNTQEKEGVTTTTLKMSMSFSKPKVDVTSARVQFRIPSELPIKINNRNYTAYGYNQSDSDISIDFLIEKLPMGMEVLLYDCDQHTGDIVIDGHTFKGYSILGDTNVDASVINIVFSKPTYTNVTLNNTTYKVDSYSNSEDTLTINIIEVDSVNALMDNAKRHTGAIVINGESYTGYTVLGNVDVQNTITKYNTTYICTKNVSINLYKPESVQKEPKQKTLTVYNTTSESTNLARREMYTDGRDISSDQEDGKTLVAKEYNEKLKQRGLEKLAQNKMTKTFEGQVESSVLFKYEEDFFMGDVIQIENEFGLEGTARVVEFIRSQDPNGYETYPTFEAIQEDES